MASRSTFNKTSCSICLEQFRDPKILSCFHTFCSKCLEDLVKRKTVQDSLECPLCRACISIPASGVAGFQCNFYIQETVSNIDALCDKSPTAHSLTLPEPGKIGRVSVTCCPNGIPTPCIVILLYTAPEKCSKPNISKKLPGPAIELTWSPPVLNEGQPKPFFTVQLEIPGQTNQEVYKGRDTSCIVKDILLGKKHLFKVHAHNAAGNGPWSESLEFIPNLSPPDAPTSLCISNIGKTFLTLTWKEPATIWSCITGYVIELESDNCKRSIRIQANTRNYKVTNLCPGKFYSFRVQSDSNVGHGSFSEQVSCAMLPDRPDKVVHVQAKSMANFVDLKWKAPNSNGREITSYKITLNGEQVIQTSSVLTEYRVGNLTPETEHTVSIAAVNSLGTSDPENIVKFRTVFDAPTLSLKCTATKDNCLTLEWEGGEGPPYTVMMMDPHAADRNYSIRYKGIGTKCTVKKLKPDTIYTFKVFTVLTVSMGTFQTSKVRNPENLKKSTPQIHSMLDGDVIDGNKRQQIKGISGSLSGVPNKEAAFGDGHDFEASSTINCPIKWQLNSTNMTWGPEFNCTTYEIPTPGHGCFCYIGGEAGFKPYGWIMKGIVAYRKLKQKSLVLFHRCFTKQYLKETLHLILNNTHSFTAYHVCLPNQRIRCMEFFRLLNMLISSEIDHQLCYLNADHINWDKVVERVFLHSEYRTSVIWEKPWRHYFKNLYFVHFIIFWCIACVVMNFFLAI